MPNIKSKARQTTSIARVSEGNDVVIKALRDGSLTMANWMAALSLEGRVFCANAGTVTDPVTLCDTGAYTETEFDLHVAVPSGTTIIPISLDIQMEAFGTALVFECAAAFGTGSVVGAGSSIVPKNIRVNGGYGSQCTITAAATTASATAFTAKKVEFFRDGHIISQTPVTTLLDGSAIETHFHWDAAGSGYYPILVGASQLGVFAAAQAGTGFITLIYAELPSSALI